jgi:hypothetical protein
MSQATTPTVETFPTPTEVRHRLGAAEQEVRILKAMLRLAEEAALFRERRRAVGLEKAGVAAGPVK